MAEQKLTIRLYKTGDEHGIIKLFKEIFGREMTLDEWKWKYTRPEHNKVYSSLAVNENNKVVAHHGCMPQRMIYNGKEIRGMAAGDVMVDPSFRGTKLFKKVFDLPPDVSAQDGFILGYGFPQKRLLKLCEKQAIYERVENVYESLKKPEFINNLARFIYKFFPLDYDDNRIDALWESLKNDIKLSIIRDNQYLQWRYKRHPFFKYELWGIKKRWQQKLTGFVMLRKDGENLLLIDFLCPLGQLSAVFQKTENYAFVSGFKNLKLWHPEYLNERMRQLGFKVGESCTCIPRSTHEKCLAKDEIKDNFFYTMGDTDFM